MSPEEAAYLASLRPSRIRKLQAGALGWTTVDIIDIDTGEGPVIRPVLEACGVRVNMLRIGQARQLVAALGGQATAPYVVLACHGDEGAIVIPELAEEMERFQPFHGRCGPAELATFARLPGSVVIATGCDTGDPALAEAFLRAGASAYIGPRGGPFMYAAAFAPILLFYELTEKRSLEHAVTKLRAHDAELSMWRLYRADQPRQAVDERGEGVVEDAPGSARGTVQRMGQDFEADVPGVGQQSEA
jgi:hypothetical protein